MNRNSSHAQQAIKRGAHLFCIMIVTLSVLSCTIGSDDDNDDDMVSTLVRLEAVLPPELDAGQAANQLLEVWVHDLDDSSIDRGARDSDQVDTALLLQSRTSVQELVQEPIEDRLILDMDFAGGVSAANNLVFAVLLFPSADSAEPTFVARAGPVSLPDALGTTVAMALGAAEIVQFDDATASEDAGSAVFTGMLMPVSPRAIALNFATQDGTSSQASPARAGQDYEASSGVVRFGAGEIEQTIVIAILDDEEPEPTEVFNVLLELDIRFPTDNRAYLAGGGNGGTFSQVLGTITDNDVDTPPPPATLIRLEAVLPPGLDAGQAATQLLEVWVHDLDDSSIDRGAGDSDQVDTALLLQSRTSVQELVQEPIEDRLILDMDFAGGVSAANNLVFAVLLFPDADSAEPTFVARAGPVSLPGALGTTVAMALGAAEIVQFDDATASEDGGSAVFTGMLMPVSPRAIALNFATQDGTSSQASPARAGQDYEASSGVVRFGAGEIEQTIVIAILDDEEPEPTEVFNVLLELDIRFPTDNRAYLAGGGNGGTFSQVVGTITDNDVDTPPPPATLIRLEAVLPPELDAGQAATQLLEVWVHDLDDSSIDRGAGDSDQVDTALLLQSRTSVQELVQEPIEDRLILDMDFAGGVSAANNLVFAVLLFPSADSAEPTFVARAGPVTLPDALGTTAVMTLGAAEIVQFDDATTREDGGSAVFTGMLMPVSPRAIALNFATQDGTSSQVSPARAGQDYEASSGVVRFGAGEIEQTIVIAILDDEESEPREVFNVLLELDIRFPTDNRAYLAGGGNGGTFSQVVGTIRDDDG